MQFNEILKKIIHTGVGRGRFWMASVGLGIAMLLILVALQVHTNFNELLYGRRNQNERADYLVVNKKITNDMMGRPELTAFRPEELKDIAFNESCFMGREFIEGNIFFCKSKRIFRRID